MNKLKEIGVSVKGGWLQLDKKKRTRLIAVVSVGLIIMGLLGYFTQRSQYTVLFANLEEADAGAIVEDLETQKIAYQLEDNGTTILIDEKQVDNYRINLAVNGLMPQSSTGFEIFDDTNMMTTDEDRQIMYQRALTGELERSIMSLQQVEAVKVMLSLPEDSIFQNPAYRSEASASIVIQTKGTELTQQNIQGIASLISGAVDRLPIGNIQIVDTNGNLLSGFLQSDGDGLAAADFSSNNQSIKRSYEQDLEQRILSLLAPVYGYNNLRVVVNAAMNFDVVEGESVEYTVPMTEEGDENREGLIRSQTESFDGASDLIAGLIEGGELPLAEEGADENSSSLDRTVNYELDQVTKRFVEAPGAVESINASVVVNNNGDAAFDRNLIETIVGTALGLRRSDEFGTLQDELDDLNLTGIVTVENMPFADGEDLVVGGGEGIIEGLTGFLLNSWPYMAMGLVLLVVAVSVLSLQKRGKTKNRVTEDYEPIEELLSIKVEEPDPIQQIEKENEVIQQKNRVMSEKEDRVKKQAKENPELAAELMKVWLKG